MATVTPTPIDLWIDDAELDEIVSSFTRLVEGVRIRSERPAFHADYAEVE